MSFRLKLQTLLGRPRNPDANFLRTALQDEYKEYVNDKTAAKLSSAALKTSLKSLKQVQNSLVEVPDKATRLDIGLVNLTLGTVGEVVLGRALLRCKTLRSVRLDGCALTGAESASHFAPLLTSPTALIEVLNLANNPGIGPAGIKVLSAAVALNRSCQEIILVNTGVTDEVVSDIAVALESTKVSRRIDLRQNSGITAASLVRLLAVLQKNVFVTGIAVDETLFGSAADKDLAKKWVETSTRNAEVAAVMESVISGSCQRTFKKKLTTFRTAAKTADAASGAGGAAGAGGSASGPLYKQWVSIRPQDQISSESKRFDAASSLDIGKRNEMQDVVAMRGNFLNNKHQDLFALFDGHGGRKAASYCATRIPLIMEQLLLDGTRELSKALSDAFQLCSREMQAWATISGTTATVLLILEDKWLLANVGDSRAILSTSWQTSFASKDHKAIDPQERERIIKLGGTIQNDRVSGQLSVTRALGDSNLLPYVSPVPEVFVQAIGEQDDFVLMASDGLWDVVSNDDVVKIVQASLASSLQLKIETSHAQIACDLVVQEAIKRGSNDNISAILVCFNNRGNNPALLERSSSTASSGARRNRSNSITLVQQSKPAPISPLSAVPPALKLVDALDPKFTASDSELPNLPGRVSESSSSSSGPAEDDPTSTSTIALSDAAKPRLRKNNTFQRGTQNQALLQRLMQTRISGYFDDADVDELKALSAAMGSQSRINIATVDLSGITVPGSSETYTSAVSSPANGDSADEQITPTAAAYESAQQSPDSLPAPAAD